MYSDKMTVFYSLATGAILSVSSGEQDMSFYGAEEENFANSIAFIYTEFDMTVFNEQVNFVVDLQTKALSFSNAVLEKYGGTK